MLAECYEYVDESCNAGCEADVEIERTSRGYSLSFHVPHVFHKFIIGKKGETKKRLETETKTQIKVPRQIEDGDIGIFYSCIVLFTWNNLHNFRF